MPRKLTNVYGRLFGLLLVVQFLGHDANKNRLWRCICLVCGQPVERTTSSLRSAFSCGCCRRKRKAVAPRRGVGRRAGTTPG